MLKKVRDKLLEAKPKWLSLDYLSADSLAKGDAAAGVNWNGDTYRARLNNKDIVYGYPKEGFNIWSTNVVVLKDAENRKNAELFQDFIMDPKNAALTSAFTRNANAIQGADEYLPDDMKSAPEFTIPASFAAQGSIMERCSPKAQDLYSRIWTEVMK